MWRGAEPHERAMNTRSALEVALGIAISLWGCNGRDTVTLADATVIDDGGSPFNFGDGGASPDVAGPTPPEALAPPAVDCDDAGACALLPSFCVDTRWLEYFDNGVCVDGGCQFKAQLHECNDECVDGGCVAPQLTAPAH